jgi:hypothetical protein
MAGDRVRDEADRLVAAAIAAVSYAARGFGSSNRPGSGFATGSAECCVCPVCRAIAVLRDPAPEFADRLAAGVSDLAAGVTSVLRAIQRSGDRAAPTEAAQDEGDEFWESLRRKAAEAAKAAARAASTVDMSTMEEDPWRAATAEPAASAPAAAPPPTAMARKAVKKAVPAPAAQQPTVPRKAVAKKAVAQKAVAQKAVAQKAVAQKAIAKKAVAKKTVGNRALAKKAVAKKTVAKKAGPRRAGETP